MNSSPHKGQQQFSLLLFISIAILWTAIIHAKELPLESFIQHGDYLDLQLSPDGQHLAGRMRKDGTVLLFILKTTTQELVGGVKPPKNTIIHSLRWANDERIVFEFAQRFSQLDSPISTGELFATNLDGTDTKLLYGFRAGDVEAGRRLHTKKDIRASQEIISLLEGDPKHILIAEYPWVTKSIPMISKLNIYTGRKTKVERIPFHRAKIVADKRGNVHFVSWYDQNDIFHAASRASKKDDWQEMELAEGAASIGKPVQINTSGNKVYLKADIGEKEIASLLELNLETGKSRTLFTQDDVDLSFWESDPETNEPVVGVSYPGSAAYQYSQSQSKMEASHKLLAKAFKGQDIFITSSTSDAEQLLVKVTGDTNPGEYYLFNTKTKKADFLWANLSWIDPREMANMQSIKLKSRDGLNLHGFLTLPLAASENPPLIVVPHGGPHGIRDHWLFDQEIQLLASRGYAVLQVNFRGSGGYGEAFEKKGYQEWGGKMIDDIIDSTKWVVEEGLVDANNICIFGASYGGYAAMMSAVKAPSLFKCVVGYVGVYDLNIMYSDGDIPRFWGGEAYLEKVLGRDAAILKENSPTSHAKEISANVMLIHGAEDWRAPIKHAKLMRKALEAVGKEVNWLSYDGAGHGVYDIKKRKDMYTQLLSFLKENLAP